MTIRTGFPAARHRSQSIMTFCVSARCEGSGAVTSGSTATTANSCPSADSIFTSPEGSSVVPSSGPSSVEGPKVRYVATRPLTVRNTGSIPSRSKVTRFTSSTPCCVPASMVIVVSTDSPGAIGSSGQVGVVQPQSASALRILIGDEPVFVRRTVFSTGVFGSKSPMTSSVGSIRRGDWAASSSTAAISPADSWSVDAVPVDAVSLGESEDRSQPNAQSEAPTHSNENARVR